MARFRGTLKGSASQVSRLGNKESGLYITADGWDIGLEVRLFVNEDGDDEVAVSLTKGSNGTSQDVKLVFNDSDQKSREELLDLSDAFFRLVVPKTRLPKLEIDR